MKTKTCTKCGEEKPLTEFYYCKKRAYLDTQCKRCFNERAKKYRKQNKEQISLMRKKYRESHKDLIKEQKRIYERNNKEKVYLRKTKYRKNNIERCRANSKRYRSKHKEKCRVRSKNRALFARQNLRDPYIRQILRLKYGLSTEDINPEMIQIEREFVAVNRLLRQKKKAG